MYKRQVLRPGLAAMTVPGGIDFGAPDKAPSDLFFMIAAPEGAGDSHLEILSRLMVMQMCIRDRNKTEGGAVFSFILS